MIKFKKARSLAETLNDLEEYLRSLDDEPVRWLAREVQSWGNEFSYAELVAAIENGRLNELIDWQEKYSHVVNERLAPLWLAAMTAAAKKITGGNVLFDTNIQFRNWIENRGGELITQLSDESRKAIMNVILRGQSLRMAPRDVAKEIRPLIGLTDRQAKANQRYREKVYKSYLDHGMSEVKAAERADKLALKYAGKQHRYRAETIVLTENAFGYNRGKHIQITQAISQGFMGRCAMIWKTAGTNRVCSRCLALKDTIVGYTDETGVTLPPLHPRCRCSIAYDEVGTRKGLGAGNINSLTAAGSPPKLIDKIENMTPATIKKTLEHYESQIVNAPVEHALIITASGEVYHCNGDVHGIPLNYFEQMRHKLEGAHVTHNHPPLALENEHTFSDDDFRRFLQFKMAQLRGIEEKFLYELNRNAKDNALAGYNLLEIYDLGIDFEDYHYAIMLKALTNGLGYWRQER